MSSFITRTDTMVAIRSTAAAGIPAWLGSGAAARGRGRDTLEIEYQVGEAGDLVALLTVRDTVRRITWLPYID